MIFRRLKKIQGKKKRDAEHADNEKKVLEAKNWDAQEPTGIITQTEEAAETSDLLSSKDEDVIF
jgi:V-type H+-transporting ATPase subunit D